MVSLTANSCGLGAVRRRNIRAARLAAQGAARRRSFVGNIDIGNLRQDHFGRMVGIVNDGDSLASADRLKLPDWAGIAGCVDGDPQTAADSNGVSKGEQLDPNERRLTRIKRCSVSLGIGMHRA